MQKIMQATLKIPIDIENINLTQWLFLPSHGCANIILLFIGDLRKFQYWKAVELRAVSCKYRTGKFSRLSFLKVN